jgi:hypothetical protein
MTGASPAASSGGCSKSSSGLRRLAELDVSHNPIPVAILSFARECERLCGVSGVDDPSLRLEREDEEKTKWGMEEDVGESGSGDRGGEGDAGMSRSFKLVEETEAAEECVCEAVAGIAAEVESETVALAFLGRECVRTSSKLVSRS